MNITGTLQDLVDALQAADVAADLEAAKVRAPGVWVTLDRLPASGYTLGRGGIVRARLFLIVQERDARRSLDALQALYDQVEAVVDPTSDVELSTLDLPERPGLPAFMFTTDLPA